MKEIAMAVVVIFGIKAVTEGLENDRERLFLYGGDLRKGAWRRFCP